MAFDFTYKCSECEEVFRRKFDFMEHQNTHTNETPFMCVSCKKSFRIIKEYVDHIEVKHISANENSDTNEVEETSKASKENNLVNENRNSEVLETLEFESSLIGKSNDSVKENNKYLNECDCCACQINDTLTKNSKSFTCSNCNKKFSTKLKLSKHACFISSSEEKFKCSCSLVFTKASAFKAHIGKKPFNCCSCSMQFNTITNLIRHIRTHTKQKPYVCKDCGRGFSQSANLRNHLSIHLGIRAIKCNECNFSCKTINGLLKHKKKHKEGLNSQNYVDGRKKSTSKSSCPICNKQFLFKRNMGMHMKVHSNKVSLCTECGKVFDSKSKLTSHHKACHREPSECKICGKVFASAVLLGAHEKIHVSDKQFSCDFCQKTFSIKNYLVQHMKTHSNKKQFSCSKCGKLFKVAVSLKYHSNICASLNIPV